ncbi:hypothetical protein QR98_0024870 [Sarcoptes scabiei]|uniref:Uncharacterized protein n=1 Tax=Sarcoptes scabiei TaxID=52283 RepID=A0A131ZYW5_SARSC|nr:hypothetical protein QR98_0024870 [Sarcoptes scabiei]
MIILVISIASVILIRDGIKKKTGRFSFYSIANSATSYLGHLYRKPLVSAFITTTTLFAPSTLF